MESVPNLSIYEYFQLSDKSEIDYYGDLLKGENLFCGQRCDTQKITFNEFHTMIAIFENPTMQDIQDLFVHLYRIRGNINQSPLELFYGEKVFQFYRAKNFLVQWLNSQLELESRMIAGDIDEKMIAIDGYKRLKPYNAEITKIKLATQFGTDPEIVGNWKYTKVRKYMAVNSMTAQIQKEYERLS